jgi:hypothetical protein
MASIGIIVRTAQELAEMPRDWVPQPLGSRADVLSAIQRCIPAHDDSLALTLRVEEPSESEEPRAISVSGVWGPRESAVLRELCSALGARFYDAEAAEFIEL